jgi:SAM-dependent methyltransferase
MIMNVVELREFYASPLGKATQAILTTKLGSYLSTQGDIRLMGLGYALPFMPEAAHDLAFMMARSGVVHWPDVGQVQSALVDELDLPLPDNSIEQALVVHGLEFSESPIEMLQELWRVLTPQGKLILVVPNRRGLWAASDATPYGLGQPFSRFHLTKLLKDSQFSQLRISPALFMPPRLKLLELSLGGRVEKFGTAVFSGLSGVLIVEATKQVYAYATGRAVRRVSSRLRSVLLPAPRPSPGHGKKI